MLSQVHDHLGSLALERIEAIHAEIGKSWWPLTITLAGEAVELQARGDVRIFVTAFEQQPPTSARSPRPADCCASGKAGCLRAGVSGGLRAP